MAATALSLLASAAIAADSNINGTLKYAYGANVGWINLEGDDSTGVVVGEFFLSGFAYGANVGWISFGDGSPADGIAYSNASATDYGVNHDGVGNLTGFAYGANIGWIDFGWAKPDNPDRARFSLADGHFSGFAYGANVGWINLGAGTLSTDSLICDDGDGDGISDAWETLQFGGTHIADATSNQDGDIASDYGEYLAATDPNDGQSFLGIVSLDFQESAPTGWQITITFTSNPSRRYQIASSSDLENFDDSGLGSFAPSEGTTTDKVLTETGGRRFFRVTALKPLQP